MSSGRFICALFALGLAAPAWAQPQGANGLLLLGGPSGWGGGCPQQSAVLEEFNLAGIPLTVVTPANWANENFFDYTMIFLEDCQSNATYEAWNDRMDDLRAWVSSGGFAGVHATRACGPSAGIQADIPDGTPSRITEYPSQGDNLVPDHPIMAGVPAVATGSSLAHDGYPNTGNPNDIVLLAATGTGTPVLFLREIGNGAIVYGGLTYSFGQKTCGATAGSGGQDAGTVLRNEVTWGSTFTLCGFVDSDGDTVGDDCDVCHGGDDTIDTDEDGVPDDCDACPNLAWPDDLDGDGICDDVDDSDGDGIVDLYDLCPQDFDPDQTDSDGDGWGDACDACPLNPHAGPRVLEWYIDADGDGQGTDSEPILSCDRPEGRADNMKDCDDTNRYIRQGAPEVCDGLDNNCDGIVDFPGCQIDDPQPVGPGDNPPTGGGCNTAPVGAGFLWLLGAALVTRRRRT